MPAPEFSLTYDHEQKRFSRDRIGITAAGRDFLTGEFFSNTFLDPITETLMLRPVGFDAAFFTSNTAPYDKLSLSDFGSPSGVTETKNSAGFGRIMQAAAGTTLQTTATFAANTGFVVSYFGYGDGTTFIALEFGWSSGTNLSAGTGVRVYSTGDAEVWRGGEIIARGQIGGSLGGARTVNQQTDIYLIPGRVRDLIIYSSQGTGFVATMPDIAESSTSPIITPNTKFWVSSPAATMSVQVAQLKFATSGHACSLPYQMAEFPDGSDTAETYTNKAFAGGAGQIFRIYGDPSYRTGHADTASAALVALDGSTAFAQDGTTRDCRLRVNLTGNGLSTPMVYGAEMGFKTLSAVTNDSEEFDVSDYLTDISLTVPDGGAPVSLSYRILDAVTVGGSVAGILTQYNRPVLAKVGTISLLDGRTGAPRYRYSISDRLKSIMVEAQDGIKALAGYVFRERKVFDGMLVSHASSDCGIKFLLQCIGLGSGDMSLETPSTTVRLGEIAPAVCGEFSEEARVGESALEVLERWMEDYLGGWFWGFVPTATGIKFVTKSPTTMDAQSPVLTLYSTVADAISTGGHSAAEAWRYVYRAYEEEIIEAEANEVVVTGFDPREQLPVQAIKRRASLQDPTIAPSLRGSGWAGEPRRYGVTNAGIASSGIAVAAADLLDARLGVPRILTPFECEFLINPSTGVPLWRGDVVTLDGIGNRIISSFNVSMEKNPDGADTWAWRPARYVSSNFIRSTGQAGEGAIAAQARANNGRRAVQRRFSGDVTRRTSGTVAVS